MTDAVDKQAAQAEETSPTIVGGQVDVRNVALSVIAGLSVIVMLQYMQAVLIPIVLAILISYALWPIVATLARVKVPQSIGAGIAVFAFIGVLGFGVWAFSDEAMGIIRDIPRATKMLRDRAEAERRKPKASSTTLEQVQEAAKEIDKAAAEAAKPAVTTPGATQVEVVQPGFRVSDYLGGNLLGFLGQFSLILFLVYFLLVTGDLYKRKIVKIAGPTLTHKKITVQILDDINRQIESFIKVQVLTSAVVAAATALALWAFGVNHYVIWGLLAGLFNSIPYIGPILVSGSLALVAFMQFNDMTKTVEVAATAMVITSLEGFLLTPALMSRASQMNPAAIFVGLLFWSWVWGVWGTILAVPMMMMIKSISDHVEDLQGVSELLGEDSRMKQDNSKPANGSQKPPEKNQG
ncbi:MAG: AI-2E family transporter [Vicinamibacterales bacterium]